MEGKADFYLPGFGIGIDIHLFNIASRFSDQFHAPGYPVPVCLRIFGRSVCPLVHRIFQTVIDTQGQRVQAGRQLFSQDETVRGGEAFIGRNRFAIHKDSRFPMAAFQRKDHFLPFPVFRDHHFTLVPRLPAVFELTAQAVHMRHYILNAFASFIHRAGQSDRFGQFT